MKASRTSSRGRKADEPQPVGQERRHVLGGMHGEIECAVEESCSSISSVNRPLPPISRERTIGDAIAGRLESSTISNIASGRPWAAIRRDRVSWAWASASGLPRVPILKGFVCIAPWESVVTGMSRNRL
jgi:hypothetical protein